ncbi:MAG: DUF2804 family protein [Thermoleophilaceae bacterium]
MADLPVRGATVRELELPLPPGRMPSWRAGRPLKRWRYVGVFAPDVMLCVGDARIGPLRQRWWAVGLPDGSLRERTTLRAGGIRLEPPVDVAAAPPAGEGIRPARARVRGRGIAIDLELDEAAGVEVVSPVGRRGAHIWTRKQALVPVRGTVEVDGRRHEIDGDHGFVDDSAGYHDRHTAWRWSAGVGTLDDGRRVGWNLVDGVHDSPQASERAVWLGGEPVEVGPVRFADDLSSVAFADGSALAFAQRSERTHSTNALLVRSRYRQPFGTFHGSLPGGLRLAEGFGVMEDHDVHW